MINHNIELSELSGLELAIVQKLLAKLDYYQSDIDGIYGKHTGHAFAQWKSDNYLGQPLMIGPESYKTLEGQADKAAKTDEIDWNNFSCKVSDYFTVGEVCMNDKRRIPTDTKVKRNIIALAKELDKVRADFGQPITVTSWYRPEAINRAVGGVRNSTHIQGIAADIRPSKGDVRAFQDWVRPRWFGALGLGAQKGFVHLDIRNGKGFQSGGRRGAIWNY